RWVVGRGFGQYREPVTSKGWGSLIHSGRWRPGVNVMMGERRFGQRPSLSSRQTRKSMRMCVLSLWHKNAVPALGAETRSATSQIANLTPDELLRRVRSGLDGRKVRFGVG